MRGRCKRYCFRYCPNQYKSGSNSDPKAPADEHSEKLDGLVLLLLVDSAISFLIHKLNTASLANLIQRLARLSRKKGFILNTAEIIFR